MPRMLLLWLACAAASAADHEISVALDRDAVLQGKREIAATAAIADAPGGGRCLTVAFSARATPSAIQLAPGCVGTTAWGRFATLEAEVEVDEPGARLEYGLSGAYAPSETVELAAGSWQTVRLALAPLHAAASVGGSPIQFAMRDAPQATTIRIRRLTLREDLAAFIADMADLCRRTTTRWREASVLTAEQRSCLDVLDSFLQQEPALAGAAEPAARQRAYDASEAAAEAASRLSPRHWTSYQALRRSADQAAAALASERPHPDYGVGIESSMRKVFVEDGPFTGAYETKARLSLARNERESFQVVVFAHDHDLAGVRLEPGPLRSAAGDVIDPASVSVAPVGYVRMKQRERGGYDLRGAEWWPDPLLTFLDAIDVGRGRAQPFGSPSAPRSRPGPASTRGRSRSARATAMRPWCA